MTRRNGGLRCWPLAAGLAAFAAGLSGPAPAQPATSKAPSMPGVDPIRVPITTADGVELDGTYLRGIVKPGRDTPCVILVHKFGADRSKSDWITLAAELQKAGFAVLTFDLRGHGGSTQVSNPDQF